MPEKPRRTRRRAPRRTTVPPPQSLGRAPRTDLQARADDLDTRMFAAVDAAVAQLTAGVDASLSLDEMKVLMTRANLLQAMRSTHRSIRLLMSEAPREPDRGVDGLALTRMQLGRCFHALLLADDPKRWHVRYQKNAWKAVAMKFFRDQQILGAFEPFAEYFGASGTGIGMLRAFAREMRVWEDEFQTLRIQVSGDDPDPRWSRREIVAMPHPAQVPEELTDPARRELARVLFPYYDNLHEFAGGGLIGAMTGAILRGQSPLEGDENFDRGAFWARHVLETSLPNSYVAVLLAAVICTADLLADHADLKAKLLQAWRPYHSDGSPLGVALWDTWVRNVLAETTEQAPPETPTT